MLPKKEETKETSSVSMIVYVITILTLIAFFIICLFAEKNYYENLMEDKLLQNTLDSSVPMVDLVEVMRQMNEKGNSDEEINLDNLNKKNDENSVSVDSSNDVDSENNNIIVDDEN